MSYALIREQFWSLLRKIFPRCYFQTFKFLKVLNFLNNILEVIFKAFIDSLIKGFSYVVLT